MKTIIERILKKENKPQTDNNSPPFKQKKTPNKKKILVSGGLALLVATGGFLWWFSKDEDEYSSVPVKSLSVQKPLIVKNKPHLNVPQKPYTVLPQNTKQQPLKTFATEITGFKQKREQKKVNTENNEKLTIPPQFVGAYLQKALEDIKREIKKELEAKAKKNQNTQTLNLSLNDIEPNLPKVITVKKVMQMPDGTIALYYHGKWLSKGMEIDNWIIENIDDKYIYIKKTFKKLVPEGNKLKEIKITKHTKIGYLISY